jgi:hypothetical protein
MREGRGTRFDRDVLSPFLDVVSELVHSRITKRCDHN